MKKNFLTLMIIALVSSVFAFQFSASAAGTYSKPGIGSEYNPIFGTSYAGESFYTGTLGTAITSVSIWVSASYPASNADIKAEIRSGSISGTVLGTATFTTRSTGKKTVNFPSAVTVAANTRYYLKISSATGTEGHVDQQTMTAGETGYYQGGTSSFDMALELVFTGGSTPTPTPTPTPTATPTPTPTPPPGWPSAATVGLHTTTTQTIAGALIDNSSWFTSHGFPGTGTYADPYLVNRVLFTSDVVLGAWDAVDTNLYGKWVKFTNCRFYGNPSNPTVGGTSDISARYYAPSFIIEDSTLGPSSGTIPGGGTDPAIGGTDKGIMSYVPFEVRRSDVFGAAIPVYLETERNEGLTTIQDNYLHDVWSSALDHTDVINGNFHASHVLVKHNYLDGHRTGNTYAVHCIGIYDDPAGAAGIIEDWTIDNNYFDRCQKMIVSTTDTARFLNPFVVKNNVFTDNYDHTQARFIGRTPSSQSNNVDQNGSPLTF